MPNIRNQLSGLIQRTDLPEDVRLGIAEALGELSTPLQSDVWIYRMIVGVLGLVTLMTVIGGIYLAVIGLGDQTISLPDGVIAIGSAAVGALAGLLAPSPRGERTET